MFPTWFIRFPKCSQCDPTKFPYGLFVLDDVLNLFGKFPSVGPPKLFQITITPHFIQHPL